MLTFAEEILLLSLDDEGELLPVPESTMASVLVGAVLMDLAFARPGSTLTPSGLWSLTRGRRAMRCWIGC